MGSGSNQAIRAEIEMSKNIAIVLKEPNKIMNNKNLTLQRVQHPIDRCVKLIRLT